MTEKIKRWPIIRHVRAFRLVCAYAWRGAAIWGIRDHEQFDTHPMIKLDKEHARKVWDGHA